MIWVFSGAKGYMCCTNGSLFFLPSKLAMAFGGDMEARLRSWHCGLFEREADVLCSTAYLFLGVIRD